MHFRNVSSSLTLTEQIKKKVTRFCTCQCPSVFRGDLLFFSTHFNCVSFVCLFFALNSMIFVHFHNFNCVCSLVQKKSCTWFTRTEFLALIDILLIVFGELSSLDFHWNDQHSFRNSITKKNYTALICIGDILSQKKWLLTLNHNIKNLPPWISWPDAWFLFLSSETVPEKKLFTDFKNYDS